MGYELLWLDNEQTITLLRVLQPWSWSEFEECFRRNHEMIRSKNYVVDNILVMGDDFRTPDPNLLSHARAIYGDIPPNNGLTIVVGASHFVKMVIQILTRAVGNKAHFVCANTIEEAQALIAQQRAK